MDFIRGAEILRERFEKEGRTYKRLALAAGSHLPVFAWVSSGVATEADEEPADGLETRAADLETP